jgi:hypothetical protein
MKKTTAMSVLAIATLSAPAWAQEMERDPQAFARPLVLVRPEPPAFREGQAAKRRYVVSVQIAADGTVNGPIGIEPDDPEMRKSVEDAARFWIFYPGLDADCKPSARSGRVEFEYEPNGEGKAWAEFAVLQGVNKPDLDGMDMKARYTPRYPASELHRGIEGRLTIALKVLPDGSTTEHRVYSAWPPSKGLVETALRHARSTWVTFTRPITAPQTHRCALIPYSFRIQ